MRQIENYLKMLDELERLNERVRKGEELDQTDEMLRKELALKVWTPPILSLLIGGLALVGVSLLPDGTPQAAISDQGAAELTPEARAELEVALAEVNDQLAASPDTYYLQDLSKIEQLVKARLEPIMRASYDPETGKSDLADNQGMGL